MKILVTAFDAFGEESINPALKVLKELNDFIKGVEIIKLELPTVFYKSAQILEEGIKEYQPDYVLALGQAGGRADITVERIAINIDDARIEDNEGNQPIDQIIQEQGQAAYFTQLPIKAMVQEMRDYNIPASVSNTAGTFVCNHIMYQLLYLMDKKHTGIKAGGFMHLPFLEQQTVDRKELASLSFEEMVMGIQVSLETIIEYDERDDLLLAYGSEY